MTAYRTTSLTPPARGSSRVNVGTNERIASAVGGVALVLFGLKKLSLTSLGLVLGGAALVARGTSGYCPAHAALGRDTSGRDARGKRRPALDLTTSLTLTKPREEVYAFWRKLENLPRFMEHLREVRPLGDGRSHWVADVPGLAATLEWDAEIVDADEGYLLAWRSVPDSDVQNAGEVRFRDATDGGTEVEVRIAYRPPAGDAGRALAGLLDPVFEQMVKEDVRRFKHVLEAGEIPTTDGQPTGPR